MGNTPAPPDPSVPNAAEEVRRVGLAIDVAVANIAAGGGPFGAVIVAADGTIVATGGNRVTASLDPTAHAEVTTIRAACQAIGDFALQGHVLYSSCEPCPLCLAACLWARLDGVVYAADRHSAHRAGFDDRVFHELIRTVRDAPWPMRVARAEHPRGEEPFDVWRQHEERTDY